MLLPEDLDPRLDDMSLRVVPMLTFLRELDGALDDEELAEEGLLPSTESSSSKFLSEKEAHKPLLENGMFSPIHRTISLENNALHLEVRSWQSLECAYKVHCLP